MPKMEEVKRVVEIPEKVEVNVHKEENRVEVKGEKGELSRSFPHPKVVIEKKGNIIEISCKKPRRRDLAMVGTCAAHIRNMIKGVTRGFEYRMKIVYSHFPIKAEVKGNQFLIHNFLGERVPRVAKILDGVEIEIKGNDVFVRGIDKEKVGQTVANIELATRIKNRDVRVFQDGIYRVSRGD